MKPSLVILFSLAALSAGCSTIVLDPIGGAGGGGAGPGDTTSGSTGTGVNPGANALALRFGHVKLPDSFMDGTGVFNFAPPIGVHPDSLAIFLASEGQACDAPLLGSDASMTTCTASDAFWQRVIVLPPELNRPGLIDLRDMRIFSYEAIWMSSCGGGSGNYPGGQGTLEITSSDATSLHIKVQGANAQGWGEVDGEYDVTRCGAAPPTPPPPPAVAVRGAAPPGSPAIDADALFIRLGTEDASCADPFATMVCNGDSRITFALPAALQKPGVLNLSDPAIAAQVTFAPGSPGCALASAAPTEGTVEIVTIDATSASLRVYRSHRSEMNGSFDADGLYAATICP